jgi:hypothetical protein
MSGIAIAGLALTVGTTTASFIQAGKQKKLAEDAATKADDAMKDARSALDVNYFEDLAVNKEAYELERDATLQAEAGALQALQESGQRGVAGGVGRLALAGQKQQAATRTAMAKELGDLEKLTAQEDSRLRDLGVQLDLEEVAGAQQAAAQAQEMRAAKISEGIQGIGSAAQQGLSMVPLYQQNMGNQRTALAATDLAKAGTANDVITGGGKYNPFKGMSTYDAQQNINSNRDLRRFNRALSPMQMFDIYGTTDFTTNLETARQSSQSQNPFR